MRVLCKEEGKNWVLRRIGRTCRTRGGSFRGWRGIVGGLFCFEEWVLLAKDVSGSLEGELSVTRDSVDRASSNNAQGRYLKK